jgi:hypothetical protein
LKEVRDLRGLLGEFGFSGLLGDKKSVYLLSKEKVGLKRTDIPESLE